MSNKNIQLITKSQLTILNRQIAKQDKQADQQTIYYTEDLSDEEIENEINKLNFKDITK